VWTGGIDTRPSPGYARRGGLYALTYDGYYDVDGINTFDRVQAEVVQHVPILRENWVVSLHGVARTTIDDHDTVPYFLLPSLGSGSTLRAYQSWRFRDRHSLLLSGEWRWMPSRMFLDLAFFYDAGKVASRREDLNFTGLKHDAGVGVRFHGPIATPLRIDVAHGSEGMNIVFSGAATF
jgi:outer membrane translocation and assembly module TamA